MGRVRRQKKRKRPQPGPDQVTTQAVQERGLSASMELAKQEVPDVADWPPDQTGSGGRVWLPTAEPFSDPAFVIELVPG